MMTSIRGESSRVEAAAPPSVTIADSLCLDGIGVSSMVMAIRSATREARIQEGTTGVRTAEADRQNQVEARLDAMRRAAEAKDEGGIWSDVANVFKWVAVAAAIVVGAVASAYTFGTSGFLAGVAVAALTAAPMVLPEAANWIADATNANDGWRLGLQGIALAACIVLAIWNPSGAVSGLSQAASSAGQTATTAARIADIVVDVGRLAQGTAALCSGLSSIEQGLAIIEEGDARADATRHEARATSAELTRDERMGEVEEVYREATRTTRIVARMIEQEEQAQQGALRA